MRAILPAVAVVMLASCGSPSAPNYSLSGTWKGIGGGADKFTFVLLETGATVGGSSVDTIIAGPSTGTVIPATVSGQTQGSSISLTLNNAAVLQGEPPTLTYTGSFTNATTISGAVSNGSRSESLIMAKQ